MTENSGRGFAGMDAQRKKEIASKGGKAAHASGNAHQFDSKSGAEAGRRGGEARGRTAKQSGNIGEGAAVNEGTEDQQMDEARNVGGTPGATRNDKGEGGQKSPDMRGGKGESGDQQRGPGKREKQASQRNQEELTEDENAQERGE